MARFLIRVELHDVPQNDSRATYEKLHHALTEKRVLNVVTGGDGLAYRLPSATYVYDGEFQTPAVRDWIKQIADAIYPNSQVLVTEYTAQAWFLQRAS